jgi:release factor glutamine methyltransferase
VRGKTIGIVGYGHIGSQVSILAETARKAGASKVLAADVNKESVAMVLSKNIEAQQSNLFSKISGKFDLIIFNPPYLPEDPEEDKESRLITTGGKKGDEIIVRFLNQASKRLNDNGKILILLSSLTPRKRIDKTIARHNLEKQLLGTKPLFMESLQVWLLQKAQ